MFVTCKVMCMTLFNHYYYYHYLVFSFLSATCMIIDNIYINIYIYIYIYIYTHMHTIEEATEQLGLSLNHN